MRFVLLHEYKYYYQKKYVYIMNLYGKFRFLILKVRKWPAPIQGMAWMALGGITFSILNTLARVFSMQMDPFEAQFLRYFCGLLVMLPLLWHQGMAAYVPNDLKGQFWRGGVHTIGLTLWFTALPRIPMADMTALGFTGPIFIMLGAAWFLGEPMKRDRWIAAAIGFAGVLVVVIPKLSGAGGF